MKKYFAGLLLALTLTLSLGMTTAFAAEADYGWEGMEGDIAIRYTHDGAETTRFVVGETYSIQFWLSGIDPYAISLPLSWNPSVVTIVDPTSGTPIPSGKKAEGEPTGFRAGSKCYQSDYDPWTYEPLYWNGRPVYTSGEVGRGGYPYLDANQGHYRFLYYDRSPNKPLKEQLFLEVFFRVDAKGDPNFHIATNEDESGIYDPASPDGLSAVLPVGDSETQTLSYGDSVKAPAVTVLTPEEYRNEATTPVDPDTKFPVDPSQISSGDKYGGGSNKGEIDVRVTLEETKHLDCFPYETAAEVNTVVRNVGGKITMDSYYILPNNMISSAVNENDGTTKSILALMPDEKIPKDEYSVVFTLRNIDDMANQGLSMIYFETPLAYVGFNTAALAAQTEDYAECRVTVDRFGVEGGFSLKVFINDKEIKNFEGMTMRLIMPYDDGSTSTVTTPDTDSTDTDSTGTDTDGDSESQEQTSEPKYAAPKGQDMFKTGTVDTYPMGLHYYNAEKKCLIFLSSNPGNYYIEYREPTSFTDMAGFDWAKESVDALSKRGIVSGVSDTSFDPKGHVTREQFATMLVRAFTLYSPKEETGIFSDVAVNDFYSPFIASAYKAGAVKGTTDTTFTPKADISRQDLAVIVYRTLTLLGVQLPQERPAIAFADDASIAAYAKEAVYALYSAGIINGVDENHFDPNGTATRAEAAKILSGVLEQGAALL